MSFNWNNYIDLAKELINSSGDLREASLRTAVSRAYYAAYNLAVDYAVEHHSYAPPKADSHWQLKEHFKTENIKVSKHLEDLNQWRKKCDYDTNVENLEQHMIPSVIHRVSNLITLLN